MVDPKIFWGFFSGKRQKFENFENSPPLGVADPRQDSLLFYQTDTQRLKKKVQRWETQRGRESEKNEKIENSENFSKSRGWPTSIGEIFFIAFFNSEWLNSKKNEKKIFEEKIEKFENFENSQIFSKSRGWPTSIGENFFFAFLLLFSTQNDSIRKKMKKKFF